MTKPRKPDRWTNDQIEKWKTWKAKMLLDAIIPVWDATGSDTFRRRMQELTEKLAYGNDINEPFQCIDPDIIRKAFELDKRYPLDGNNMPMVQRDDADLGKRVRLKAKIYTWFRRIRRSKRSGYIALITGVTMKIPGYGPKDGEGELNIVYNEPPPTKSGQRRITAWLGNRRAEVRKRDETLDKVEENSQKSAKQRALEKDEELRRRAAERRRRRGNGNP